MVLLYLVYCKINIKGQYNKDKQIWHIENSYSHVGY